MKRKPDTMRFVKYHALGNDYLVCDPADFPEWQEGPPVKAIRAICHRNFGAGSDGILWGPLPAAPGAFGLRIFNPDGSEAEKSGNGLRIFIRYLYDRGLVNDTATVTTPGGTVQATLAPKAATITIDMGHVRFGSDVVPVRIQGPAREVVSEPLRVLDRDFLFTAATIGNPHCVIPLESVDKDLACKYGPVIENHPLFPHRTNVQFLQVLDRKHLRIEIWERGAGYTLASGSSSSAAAAAAVRLGLADRDLTLHMPGGILELTVGDAYAIRMKGTVTRVADGKLDPELLTFGIPRE